MILLKDALRRHLEKVFVNQELTQWFDPLAMAVDEDKKIIRVSFPHVFFRQWFMERRKNVFEFQLSPFLQDMELVYEGEYSGVHDTKGGRSLLEEAFDDRMQTETLAPMRQPGNFSGSGDESASSSVGDLHFSVKKTHFPLEHYRFDTFIANKKNDFPLAAAQQAVEKALSPAYIPFVVYGKSGSGKTHLLCAMAGALSRSAPEAPVFYGGIEYLERMRFSRSSSFPLQKHIVFLDDIQRAYRNPALQDALIALIDACYVSRRLLVLCADAHPANSPEISAKLLSRLTGGLVAELKKPDLDVRRRYLQRKNRCRHLGLSKARVLSLAQQYQDIRSIDGFLARLSMSHSLANHQDGDMEKFLEQSFGEYPLPLLTLDRILELVADQFAVSKDNIIGNTRGKSLSLARSVAMLLCRELLGLSLVQVGQKFGGRDHSSVIYLVKKIKMLKESDKDVNSKVTILRQMCLSGR